MCSCKHYLKRLDKGISRLSQGKRTMSNLSEYEAANLRLEHDELYEQLKNNFGMAVESYCLLSGIHALIITIDDADTRSIQCANVMEDLRLYVKHPRLIVLLTGDKDMYLERIRELHFCEYNHHYHTCDEKGQEGRMNSISFHANQYILKLFPLDHQYELQNILTLVTKNEPIKINIDAIAHSKGIWYDFREIFKITINSDPDIIGSFANQFLCLPLRSIIEVCKYLSSHSTWKAIEEWKRSTITDVKRRNQLEQQILWDVKEALKHVLQNQIRSLDYNIESLNVDVGSTYYSIMMRHCQNIDDLEYGFYLSGKLGIDDGKNYIPLLLAVSFRNRVRNLGSFISYLIFGPATIYLYSQERKNYVEMKADLMTQEEKRKYAVRDLYLSSEDLYNSYINYMHVGGWISPTRWARNANTIFCRESDYEGVKNGIVRIVSSQAIGALVPHINSYLDKLLTDSSLSEDTQKKLIFNAISLAVSTSSDERDKSCYISIFSFFAFILKCIQICKDTSKEKQEKELMNFIKSYAEIKLCRHPEWHLDKKVETKNELISTTIGKLYADDIEKYIKILINDIIIWYNESIITDDYTNDLSPQTVGRFWSSISRKLGNISLKVTTKKKLSDHITTLHTTYTTLNNTYSDASKIDGGIASFYCYRLFQFPLIKNFLTALEDYVTLLRKDEKVTPFS